MVKLKRILIAGFLASAPLPVSAQGIPAFRVPLDQGSSSGGVPSVYSWVADSTSCSNSCGSGTRTTTYQCQDVSKFDAVTGDFGNPEPMAQCHANLGAAPETKNSICTNFAGCNYDWVKPAEIVTLHPVGTNPVGRVGCGNVQRIFDPVCKRNDGAVLAKGDHAFCKNDMPDYTDVRDGRAGALGYDRTAIETSSCNATDNQWKSTSWSEWSSTCSATALRTRQVQCIRKFDGSVQSDSACAEVKPIAHEVQGQYGSCTYEVTLLSQACVEDGIEERNYGCQRSDGYLVAGSFCGLASLKQTVAAANCNTQGWVVGEWSKLGTCSGANRARTRAVTCEKGGVVVDDAICLAIEAKPQSSETEPCPTVPCNSGSSWTWNGYNWDDYRYPNWEPNGGVNGTGPWGTTYMTNITRVSLDRTHMVSGITVRFQYVLSDGSHQGYEMCGL